MVPLSMIRPGEKVKIVDIKGGRGKITRMYEMGIRIGDIIEVIQNYHGPLIIAKDYIRLALGRGFANKIMVEKLGRGYHE